MLKMVSPRNMGFIAACLMVVVLGRARAFISIGMVSLAIFAIWQLVMDTESRDLRKHKVALIIGSLFFLTLLSGLWADDLSLWSRDLKTKLPLLVIPLAFSIVPSFTKKQYIFLFGLMILSHVLIGLVSVGNYALNYEALNISLGRNAPVPIIIGGSHIYFGLVLAFCTLLSFDLFHRNTQAFHHNERWVFLGLGIVGFICLHIIVTRTGLMAFYAGAMVYLVLLVFRKKNKIYGILLIAFLISVPWIAYYTIPSFHKKVHLTIWDASRYQKKKANLDHHSVALRLVSWQAAWDIFKENPITGVGMGDVKKSLFEWYEENDIRVSKSQWLANPHNQYLEVLMGLGIPGFLILLVALLSPLFYRRAPSSGILFAFLALFAVGMLTESSLERQIGIALFTIGIMLMLKSNLGNPISQKPER